MTNITLDQLQADYGADRVAVFDPQPDLLPLEAALTPQVKLALESTMNPGRPPSIPQRHLDHLNRLNGMAFTLSTHTVMDCAVSALLADRLLYLIGLSAHARGTLRTVLHETLLNAAIHGNMGISGPTLRNLHDYATTQQAIEDQRNNPDAMQRLITVVLAPHDQTVRFIVADEGDGFDTGRLYTELQQSTDIKANGRGLKMVQGMTTSLQFHDGGAAIEFTIGK